MSAVSILFCEDFTFGTTSWEAEIMEDLYKTVEDVTDWLEEKGFSADIIDAFTGRLLLIVTHTSGTLLPPLTTYRARNGWSSHLSSPCYMSRT